MSDLNRNKYSACRLLGCVNIKLRIYEITLDKIRVRTVLNVLYDSGIVKYFILISVEKFI